MTDKEKYIKVLEENKLLTNKLEYAKYVLNTLETELDLSEKKMMWNLSSMIRVGAKRLREWPFPNGWKK